MKPIVYKQNGFWWVIYRDGHGKCHHAISHVWDIAINVALMYAEFPPQGGIDCE